jgi:DNA-binding NarL/FixJ family response regulator
MAWHLLYGCHMKTTERVLASMGKSVGGPGHGSLAAAPRRVLRVWVVDDNAALRVLFAQLLSKQPGIRCTRQFASAEDVLATLAEERPPDIILLDVHLGGESGLSAIRPIKRLAPSVKVLMLTMFSNIHYELEAFRAGASGFLLKSFELKEIVELVHEAHRNPGSRCLFPNLALQKEAGLEVKEADGRHWVVRFGLAAAFRRLCVTPRRQTAA